MLASRLAWTLYMVWHTRGQANYPFRKPAELRQDQARRVRRIVTHAWLHVPYYRETMRRLGLTPDDFRSADDLAKLPVVRREQLQRDPEAFNSRVGNRKTWLLLRSGGSSGHPVIIFHSKAEVFYLAAVSARFRSIVQKTIGRKAGYRETHILPDHSSNTKIRLYWQEQALVPDGIPAKLQRLSLADAPETNARLINEFKPDALYGFGSYLGLLFATVHARGLPFHKPKLVAFGADDLPPSSRRLIQDTFGIPAFSMYHCVECSRLAFECEKHTGVHVNADVFPVRITDAEGRTLPEGEQGEVVISNLLNTATVLLNYRLGDLATTLPPCPCGRSLPLISYPQGRCEDWVVLPSGSTFNANNLIHLPDECRSVWQWQIVQENHSRFVVKLVVDPARDVTPTIEHIRQHFTRMLGTEIAVDIRLVDSIERPPSGKHRVFVSLVGRDSHTDGECRTCSP